MSPAPILLSLFVLAAPLPEKAKTPTTRLYIRTVPSGAKVILDGKLLGTSDGLFLVPPGAGNLVIELDSYDSVRQQVRIQGQRITRVELTLRKQVKLGPQESRARGPYRESRCADMPLAIHDFACSDVLNGKFYVFGGDRANDVLLDTILVYDTTKDQWRKAKGKMPYAYCSSGGTNLTAICGGKIYISPGLGPRRNNGWGQHRRIIEFDPATETAVEKASFGATVWCVSPVTFRNVTWWFGACGLGQEKKIWRYDPARNLLVEVSRLSGPGRSVSAILGTDGRIYLFGGNHEEKLVEIYDPDTNNCTLAKASLPQSAGVPHVWPGPGDLIHIMRPMHNPRLWSFDVSTGKLIDLRYTYSFSKTCDGPGHAYDPDTGRIYFFGGRNRGIGERSLTKTFRLSPNE